MLVPILRSVSAFLCALATVYAGTPLDGFSPVKVGEGPLVCFIHPENESGSAVSGGGQRTEVMYLCDPAAGANAVPVWRGQAPRVAPLQRLTQNLALIERNSECYLGDMAKGSATPLWHGENQTSFLKAEGGKIFFLRRLLPETSYGMKLGSGKNGKDGKWAAFCDPNSNGVFLLDGANRRKHGLVNGWSYGIKWLAAVDAGK